MLYAQYFYVLLRCGGIGIFAIGVLYFCQMNRILKGKYLYLDHGFMSRYTDLRMYGYVV
jgi:hypothetical protein